MTSTITNEIRQLPLFIAGFNDGQDVGLRLALDQLTQERLKQERLLARLYPTSTKAARISYAEASLRAVSKRVAALFRQ
jgi:hypothetical protein